LECSGAQNIPRVGERPACTLLTNAVTDSVSFMVKIRKNFFLFPFFHINHFSGMFKKLLRCTRRWRSDNGIILIRILRKAKNTLTILFENDTYLTGQLVESEAPICFVCE